MGGTVCMEMKKMLNNDRIKPYLLKARFGVEKESQRVAVLPFPQRTMSDQA